MDPVQSTAGKAVLDTIPDAAEQKPESGRLGRRILRACRPMCCSAQTDEKTEPSKQLQDRSGSQSPKVNEPVVSVSDTSTIASQKNQTSDSVDTTTTDADANSSLPASEPSAGQRRASAGSAAGNFAGDTDSKL